MNRTRTCVGLGFTFFAILFAVTTCDTMPDVMPPPQQIPGPAFELTGSDTVHTLSNVGIGTTTPAGRLHVAGAVSQMIFDTDASGDASVALPAGAISAAEIMDEPSVANAYEGGARALSRSLETILSQAITVPADGFVLAIASYQAKASHIRGTTDAANFDISDTAGVIFGTQDVAFLIDSVYPTGDILLPAMVHELFPVSAGDRTFYFAGVEMSGDVTVNDPTLTLIYFPTAGGVASVP